MSDMPEATLASAEAVTIQLWAPVGVDGANRNPNLDVLRGVAVLLVICHHLGVPGFVTGGWIGVDLFFILSGFLISGLLFREWRTTRTIRLGRFFLRRAFKIYPAFYALLLVTALINWKWPGIPSHPVSVRSLLAELMFVQNYVPGIWAQTWSLAVEEHFYLLLPFALFFLLSRRNKGTASNDPFAALPMVFGAVAAAELILRLATTSGLADVAYEPVYAFRTHLRFDTLFFGVLLGYYYHFVPAEFAKYAKGSAGLVIAGLGVLLAFLVDQSHPITHTLGYSFLMFGLGFLLCKVIDAKPLRMLWPIAKLGVYSYSVYLWHGWSCRLLPRRTATEYCIAFAAAILPGIVMAHLIEMPALRLRDWMSGRTTPLLKGSRNVQLRRTLRERILPVP